jgi:hypothetical protein
MFLLKIIVLLVVLTQSIGKIALNVCINDFDHIIKNTSNHLVRGKLPLVKKYGEDQISYFKEYPHW